MFFMITDIASGLSLNGIGSLTSKMKGVLNKIRGNNSLKKYIAHGEHKSKKDIIIFRFANKV